jgi:nucleoid DNA-binding protein
MMQGIPQDKMQDVLLTKTAIKTLKPLQIVERVIAFQFKDAREATRIVDEVEISGFGKFSRSRKRTKDKLKSLNQALQRMQEDYDSGVLSDERMNILKDKIDSIKETIQFLEGKVIADENRPKRNNRRSEEQSSSS